MRKIIFPLAYALVTALTASSQTNVSYTAFNGTVYNMRAFFAVNTVTLIPEDKMVGLDTNVVKHLANITDSSYDYAKFVTGKYPPLSKHINGKATIAYVEETCGAGCGIVGATGVEVGTLYFSQMYNGVKNGYIRGAIYAYEIGRNFWFYGNKVNFTSGFFGGWAEAFATQMHQRSPRYVGSWKEYPLSETSYFETELSRFALGCIISDTLNYYANLISANQQPLMDRYRNPRMLNYYAHAFLAFLNTTFGDDMIFKFWKEVDKLPARTTNQDAIDNVLIAASRAVGKNLTYLFETLFRFPISASAKNSVSTLSLPAKEAFKDVSDFYVTSSVDDLRLALIINSPAAGATYTLYLGLSGDASNQVAQNTNGRFNITIGCGKKRENYWIQYKDPQTTINSDTKKVFLRLDFRDDVEDKLVNKNWYEYYASGKFFAVLDTNVAGLNSANSVKMFGENPTSLNDEVRLSRPFYVEANKKYKVSIDAKIKYLKDAAGAPIGDANFTVGFWGGICSEYDAVRTTSENWINVSHVYSTANFNTIYPTGNYITQKPYFNFVSDKGAVVNVDNLHIEDVTYGDSLQVIASQLEVCTGDSVKLSSDATNVQWYKDGSAISGANNGIYYAKQSGRYTIARQINGICYDVAEEVVVTIKQSPTTPIILLNTFTGELTSSHPAGNQWYLNNNIINGATAQSLKPTQTGNYSVRTTLNTCSSAMSANFNYAFTGIVNVDNLKVFQIMPNPAKDKIYIVFKNQSTSTYSVEIMDLGGHVIKKVETVKNNDTIDIKDMAAGVYILKFSSPINGNTYTMRIVKE